MVRIYSIATLPSIIRSEPRNPRSITETLQCLRTRTNTRTIRRGHIHVRKRALNQQPFQIFEDGSQTRHFMFVSDLVDATVAALDKNLKDRVFNIASGTEMQTLAAGLEDYLLRTGDLQHPRLYPCLLRQRIGFDCSVPETEIECKGCDSRSDVARSTNFAGSMNLRSQPYPAGELLRRSESFHVSDPG